MKLSRLFYITFFASSVVLANDVEIAGSLHQLVPSQQPSVQTDSDEDAMPAQPFKQITLLKLNLSQTAKKTLQARTTKLKPDNSNSAASSDAEVQLGMNDVPVLDQGMHGTCVTFANTAAIDAMLNKGDYISQLCQLQLGNHFENQAYSPSGWEGSFGPMVLSQISIFGVVNKDNQKAVGCAGATEYPLADMAPSSELTVPEFHQISEPVANVHMTWSSIFDINQAFSDDLDPSITLDKVKKALIAGDRVTFGVLLVDTGVGTAGAVGKFHVNNDAWILTPEIINDLESGDFDFGGHEMIITGFNDQAVAVDGKGREYRGLLTLRNSWGESVGDKGEFYMSYDYFKILAIEAQRIRSLNS